MYGQGGGNAHIKDESIAAYRNSWLTTIVSHNDIAAVITLGTLAASAYHQWLAAGATFAGHHAAILHPTYPESASAAGQITLADATKRLLANWNDALPGLIAAIDQPDEPASGTPYGTAFTEQDLPPIPPGDPTGGHTRVDAHCPQLGHPARHRRRHETGHDRRHGPGRRPSVADTADTPAVRPARRSGRSRVAVCAS